MTGTDYFLRKLGSIDEIRLSSRKRFSPQEKICWHYKQFKQKAWLKEHNSGKSPYTKAFAPWRIVVAIKFADDQKADHFEKYLKSGSGHAFANRHFW